MRWNRPIRQEDDIRLHAMDPIPSISPEPDTDSEVAAARQNRPIIRRNAATESTPLLSSQPMSSSERPIPTLRPTTDHPLSPERSFGGRSLAQVLQDYDTSSMNSPYDLVE